MTDPGKTILWIIVLIAGLLTAWLGTSIGYRMLGLWIAASVPVGLKLT